MSSGSDELLKGVLLEVGCPGGPLTFLALGCFSASVGYILGLCIVTKHPPDMSSSSDEPLEGALMEEGCPRGPSYLFIFRTFLGLCRLCFRLGYSNRTPT